jgi:hypothetical protein
MSETLGNRKIDSEVFFSEKKFLPIGRASFPSGIFYFPASKNTILVSRCSLTFFESSLKMAPQFAEAGVTFGVTRKL